VEAPASRCQCHGAWEAVVYLLLALTTHRLTRTLHLGTSVLEVVAAAQPVLSCISQVSEYNYSALYLGQEASAQVESQGQVVHLHWPGVEAEVDVLTWN